MSGLPPVSLPDPYLTLEEAPLVVNAASGVLANDTDPESDPLTAVLDVGPLFGTLNLSPDGSFTYTPNLNSFGIDTFTYHANDGTSDGAPTLVTLTVTGVNDLPIAVPDGYIGTEDTPLTVNAANGVLSNDIDVDGDPLTAVLDIGPVNGVLALNSDGSFTYTPNLNFFGTDAFTYHANDGNTDSLPTVVSLTVASVNDAPPVSLPDLYTEFEDTAINVNAANGVLANDLDVDGDTLTAVLDIGPLFGSLTLNPDGSFIYTPNANTFGGDTFTYHANDGTADGLPAVVTLTILSVNDIPVALPDAYAASEDTPLTVNAANGVLANDIDLDGDPLTAVLDIGPLNGSLTLNPDGSFTYTPIANFFGADTFIYHANDGTSNSPPALVVLTIAGVNDAPPVALPDVYTTSEDTVLTVNAANGVLVNDIDIDGDPLTAIVGIGPLNGSLTLNPDGSFTYTPNANFFGVDTFTYFANDGTVNSLPAVVTLTLASVNDAPPVALPDSYAASEDTTLTVNAASGVLANDTDLDGDPLTAVLDFGPLNGTLTLNPDGSFTYTPDANFFGVDTFIYHANDGTSNSAPALVTLTIAGVNDAPPVAVPDAYTASEDTVLTVSAANGVLVNDIDLDGDPLTAILDVGPLSGSLTLNPNGSFTYTPNANFFGVDTFTYHANDGTVNSLPTVVTLTLLGVNDAPPVALSDFYAATEDTTLTVNAANGVLANDTDLDGDPLTAVLDFGPLNGMLTFSPNGSFTYTPDANFFGIDTFIYHANDGTSNSPPALVTLTVTAVNDAPPVAVPDSYTSLENATLTVSAANGVLANDLDIDGDTLTAILDVGPVSGTLALNPDGSFTYTPNTNFLGVDTFTYHANDGTANSLPTVVTLTITTSALNTPPVAVPDAYAASEDTALTVNAASGVLANDTDVNGDSLTAILDFGPLNGTVVLNLNGSFTYTPNANFFGVDSFIYHANDGISNSPPAIVTLTVAGVNDAAPVAVPDAYTTPEDTVLSVSAGSGVLANDMDIDGNTLTAILDVGPTNGTLTLNPNGSFIYTPSANFDGIDSFTYHANDGTFNSLPTVVTLTITSVNDAPPVAVTDAYTTPEDTVLTVNAAAGVLANDTDADGDTLTAVLDFGPQNGTLVLNANGSFTYTPSANFNGVDSFIYHANDGTSNSPPALVTLTVTAVSDGPPVASPDAYTAAEDGVLIVSAANGVLANDTDPDGDPLTAILGTAPTNGTLVLDADGSFVYTPDDDFNGTDSFTYHANDGTGNSNTVTVTLTVTDTNDPPVSANDAYFINEDAVLTVGTATGVLANDSDPDGDTMTAVIVTPPTNGTVVLSSDGSFAYTPNADYNGSDSFTYRANDGTENGNVATVNITINPQNEAPIIITSPGSQSARKHKRVVLDPAINLIDTDSPNFGGGNLDIAIQSGAGAKDFLGYRKGGANKGLVNAKRGQLRIGRTVIGSITGGKRSSPVHIEYNSNASQDRVELAMQSLIFRGTGKQAGPRVVSWQITDDTGLDSNVATKSVDVTR